MRLASLIELYTVQRVWLIRANGAKLLNHRRYTLLS
nr:MAG TPA: hypothetical protein [Caudoviricetes sp.]